MGSRGQTQVPLFAIQVLYQVSYLASSTLCFFVSSYHSSQHQLVYTDPSLCGELAPSTLTSLDISPPLLTDSEELTKVGLERKMGIIHQSARVTSALSCSIHSNSLTQRPPSPCLWPFSSTLCRRRHHHSNSHHHVSISGTANMCKYFIKSKKKKRERGAQHMKWKLFSSDWLFKSSLDCLCTDVCKMIGCRGLNS